MINLVSFLESLAFGKINPISIHLPTQQVWRCLKKLEKYNYLIAKIIVDPLSLGDASKRRRVYVVIVRKDVVRPGIRSHIGLTRALLNTLQMMVRRRGEDPPDPPLDLLMKQSFLDLFKSSLQIEIG